MEPKAYVIEFFSNEWIRNSIITLLGILSYLFVGKRLPKKSTLYFGMLISVALIVTTITGHSRNIINGYWNISKAFNIAVSKCSDHDDVDHR